MLTIKISAMRVAAVAIVLSLLEVTADDEGFCSAETKSDCESDGKQTYSQVSSEIWGKIEAAEAGYKECRQGGCQCYEAVIDSDLAKFPKVTREMLSDTRDVNPLRTPQVA